MPQSMRCFVLKATSVGIAESPKSQAIAELTHPRCASAQMRSAAESKEAINLRSARVCCAPRWR